MFLDYKGLKWHVLNRRLRQEETLAVSRVVRTVAIQATVADPNVNYIKLFLPLDLRGVKSRLGKEPLLRIVLGVIPIVLGVIQAVRLPITMAPVRVQAIRTDSS